MAAKKRGLDAGELNAMAQAFDVATETDSKSAWEKAGTKILALLRACATADDVERVLRAHRGVFEVEGSLYPCPKAVDVLFERIAAMDAEDAGRALGWLSRACAPPDLVASPDRYPRLRDRLKDPARSAVEQHAARLRAWIDDDSPERRSGAAYLLANWVRHSTVDGRKGRLAGNPLYVACPNPLGRPSRSSRTCGCRPRPPVARAHGNATSPVAEAVAVSTLVCGW